jgi:hypothetical protein
MLLIVCGVCDKRFPTGRNREVESNIASVKPFASGG